MNVEKSCRLSSVRSAAYNSDFFMVFPASGEERGGEDTMTDAAFETVLG
jgi:hypothetical protein